MASLMDKFYTGQPVMMTGTQGPTRAQVMHVGRVYVFAARQGEVRWRKFRIETGDEDTGNARGHIYTLPEWEDYCQRGELLHKLHGLGVTQGGYMDSRFASATNAQLRAMIQILLPEKLTGDVEQVRSQLAFLPVGSQVRCHWPDGEQEDHYAVRVRANGAGSENWSLLNETGWLNMATWGCEIWVEHRAHWSANLVSENELTPDPSES